MKIVYFVHGTTYDNASKKCSGWSQVELNELGREQASKLPSITPYKFDLMFTSDLVRAIDSANIAFSDVSKFIDWRLRECNYGDLDGAFKDEVNYLEHIHVSFPNGESLDDVLDRVKSFLRDIIKKYPDKTIGIMAHRAPQLALEVICKHISFEDAISNDWRNTGNWMPGFLYDVSLDDL